MSRGDGHPSISSSSGRVALGIVAALVAVLLTAFFCGCAAAVVSVDWPRQSFRPDDYQALFLFGSMTAMFTLPFAALAALTVGIPIFIIWRRWGFNSFLHYIGAGILIGLVLGLAVLLAHYLIGFLESGFDFPLALSIIGIGGPVAAVVYRSIVRVKTI